jgi:glycine dehydrogenase
MDGANLNAQVGLARPADIGADVSHMNLHKTFCIPHGGGGRAWGRSASRAPGAVRRQSPGGADRRPAAAERRGQRRALGQREHSADQLDVHRHDGAATGGCQRVAILAANYLAQHLSGAFPVLYTGRNGRVAHECILDLRPLKAQTGISEEDVAKRLMDYGFHAPTMSFPVPGTLMVEPTESESKAELDRFIGAMLSIRAEITEVQNGNWPAEDNPLKRAPHTLADVTGVWERPYSIEQGITPDAHTKAHKYWPAVNRVDNVYGDRNLFCACVPVDEYR